jgi:hypothetical protein
MPVDRPFIGSMSLKSSSVLTGRSWRFHRDLRYLTELTKNMENLRFNGYWIEHISVTLSVTARESEWKGLQKDSFSIEHSSLFRQKPAIWIADLLLKLINWHRMFKFRLSPEKYWLLNLKSNITLYLRAIRGSQVVHYLHALRMFANTHSFDPMTDTTFETRRTASFILFCQWWLRCLLFPRTHSQIEETSHSHNIRMTLGSTHLLRDRPNHLSMLWIRINFRRFTIRSHQIHNKHSLKIVIILT